jgi:uncharacterized membrane protein YhaH (DUF805 family)
MKMDRKSYIWTMLFALPAFAISNVTARSNESVADFAKIISLVLAVFVVIWSIRRLRNIGKSGWWSLALIPPATIFLVIYSAITPGHKEYSDGGLYMYGIRAKGFWKIAFIVVVTIFLLYLTVLFATFLTDGL